MKTIVVYYSKHGSAKTIAERAAKELQCDCVDVRSTTAIQAQQVLLVCGVYIGRIPKEMKELIHQLPADTRIGFLKVGLNADDIAKILEENLKEDKEKISFYRHAGGVLTMSKLGLFEKLIIRMVNSQSHMIEKGDKRDTHSFLREEEIQGFLKSAAV